MQAAMPAKLTKSPPPEKQQIAIRLDVPVWLRLNAMAGVLGVSQSQVVTDGIHAYYEKLVPKTQQAIDQAAAIQAADRAARRRKP